MVLMTVNCPSVTTPTTPQQVVPTTPSATKCKKGFKKVKGKCKRKKAKKRRGR
jgi:hypothetical protein